MTCLFHYPKTTEFNKPVPKTKILAHSRPSTVLREQLTDQVAQIVWKHKLFSTALNLHATGAVSEIQIFEIFLKGEELAEGVLKLIDRAVAFPIIFELHRADHVCVSAAYKRPSGADSAKWVVGDYFRSPWLPVDTERAPLPLALDLGALYREMLQTLMPHVPFPGETMEEFAERVAAIASKQKACDKLQGAVNRERQFNRRVELNRDLQQAKSELADLKNPPVHKKTPSITGEQS